MCLTLRQAHDPLYTAVVYRARLDIDIVDGLVARVEKM
jgi:hypothetical protein